MRLVMGVFPKYHNYYLTIKDTLHMTSKLNITATYGLLMNLWGQRKTFACLLFIDWIIFLKMVTIKNVFLS